MKLQYGNMGKAVGRKDVYIFRQWSSLGGGEQQISKFFPFVILNLKMGLSSIRKTCIRSNDDHAPQKIGQISHIL